MERQPTAKLRIGDWCVDPSAGVITRNDESARIEARAMRLLVCLAERAGAAVSIEDLLNEAWAGVAVSQDSVYQAVASLRRQLGDDSKEPKYIATVPRLGYKLVAPVAPWTDESTPKSEPSASPTSSPSARRSTGRPEMSQSFRSGFAWAAGAALFLLLGIVSWAFLVHGKSASSQQAALATVIPTAASQQSIAVVPFLDLTEGMQNEEFADGMTEELIDKLSKIPGLRVPSPTSSFFFKGKQVAVGEMAKTLGVLYLLDGSVRKSGKMVRVAARLVRADNGYVLWTESYDRPFDDILMVQDDIAGEVAKALKASIATGTNSNTPH